jgi:hypothetical protein
MKDLVELKSPRFLLIIHVTTMLILWDVHIYMLYNEFDSFRRLTFDV